MPDLPQDKPVPEEHGPGIDIFTPGKPGEYDLEGGIWEDEDARNFYENLIDLKAFVPAILFKDNERCSQNKDTSKDDSKALQDNDLQKDELTISRQELVEIHKDLHRSRREAVEEIIQPINTQLADFMTELRETTKKADSNAAICTSCKRR
ncbi:UNVERIFIED_CONTAM: hypothetical protein K2H54_055145 [Gekko kuhli]